MRVFHWVREYLKASVRNAISMAGLTMASVSGAIILTILVLDFLGFHGNPYLGVLVFLVLPAFLLLGVVLIPLGVVRSRHKETRRLPVIDLNLETHQTRLLGFLVLAIVNIVILSSVTYRGIEWMDSTQFCGEVCHSVMAPELTAYSRSPHSRVACVDCHIGTGAGWFVRSKLAGVGQVFAVNLNTYERPIPAPIHNLRPARETCEQCHWPEKFHGDRIKVNTKFSDDEVNTELKTVLILKVGGGSLESGFASGIHWHMNIANEVLYLADDKREAISFVRFRSMDGHVTDYLMSGTEPPTEDEIRRHGRRMDCVDCHNRPTHIFRLPEEEVDALLYSGRIDRTLPYARRTAVSVLSAGYASHDEARAKIPEAFTAYYRENYPAAVEAKQTAIAAAGEALVTVHNANVFPEMKITWGTYANHIGHMTSPGCMRCHDGEHASADGRTISADCENCHTLLAVEENAPEVMQKLFPEGTTGK